MTEAELLILQEALKLVAAASSAMAAVKNPTVARIGTILGEVVGICDMFAIAPAPAVAS